MEPKARDFEAFAAGWCAREDLADHEWGPSPPKTPEAAFAHWLKTCARGHIVPITACAAPLPDGRECWSVKR